MKGLEKIAQMVGKSYMYCKEVYAIKGFIPEERGVRIKTDHKDIFLLEDDLPSRLQLFLPTDETRAEIQVMPQTNALGQIRGVLMETLEKVQKDKDYVPQASQINKTATALTNLMKTELEFLKLMKKA
ncbi:hypothetical protein [Rufibacter roseus]|uniref:Uncharacterized protein n=1 Tax=Rufibacter roseus TaxID=1567108 RepID=A0ABW2DMN9_9BACT|nr:hypothetical protein [Rufibacter roseus]